MPGTTAPAAMAVINLRHSMSCSNNVIGIWIDAFFVTISGVFLCFLLWSELWHKDYGRGSQIAVRLLWILSLLMSCFFPVLLIIAMFYGFDFSGLI